MSVVVHLRIPEPLYSRLKDVCGEVQQPSTEVIRRSLQYVLDHPEVWIQLLAQAVEDTSTPEQRRNAEHYLLNVERINHAALLSESQKPLPY